jgi:pyrroloquinoline quinone biosynthesis protein B
MRVLFAILLILTSFSLYGQNAPFLVVLGTVQDAGSPHIGCQKACCSKLFEQPDPSRKVVCLGLVDPASQTTYLFEATPDFSAQVKMLKQNAPFETSELPDGIFLTHAHIGHYTGLMYLGREAIGADSVKVYAMPRMKSFLEENGPWDQLVSLGNIRINGLESKIPPTLEAKEFNILPFEVPHRDEYSETVGYLIYGPNKKALFLPDIDKWEKWDTDIREMIKKVDYAFLDATFFDGEEINNRDIAEIPHPFVIESMALFKDLPEKEKDKVYFIHFNHTNPLLNSDSPQAKLVREKGFHIAEMGMRFGL